MRGSLIPALVAVVFVWASPALAASNGNVSLQETNSGLDPTTWSSNAPPPSFPTLCASASQCGNSLASTFYVVVDLQDR